MTEAERRVGAVFLDVDGTLLRPDHTISPATAAAVSGVVRVGIAVILCSSRSPEGVALIQDQLRLRGQIFVAFQGAMVARWKGEYLEIIAERRMRTGAIAIVEERALSLGLTISSYAETTWKVLEANPAIRRAASITGEVPTVVDSLAAPDSRPHKLLVIASTPDRHDALDELQASLPATVEASRSHVNYLEITDAAVNKGEGLRIVCESLDLIISDTLAIGDGMNDLAMLDSAGWAVAMGQAPPEVRAIADEITKDNENDGVAAVLRRLEHYSTVHHDRSGT